MYTGSLAAVSNRADWVETITITDQAGGFPAVTEANVAVTGCGVNLTGSISGGGVTYDPVTGTLVFTFSDERMRCVPAGEYQVGVVITIDDVQTQLFAGTVPVVAGVVA